MVLIQTKSFTATWLYDGPVPSNQCCPELVSLVWSAMGSFLQPGRTLTIEEPGLRDYS